jgi:hypothetical protein
MKELKKLIDLKSIITMVLTGLLGYGFVVNKITAEQFLPILTMVMTFYFAKPNKKGEVENGKE